jgi:hypothetical protein
MIVVGGQVAVTHLGMIPNSNREPSSGRNPRLDPLVRSVANVLEEEVLVGSEKGDWRGGF